MRWTEFKQMTVREHLEFGDLLAQASTVEAGTAVANLTWKDGRAIEDHAKELVIDFADAATPFDGVLELVADQAIMAAVEMTDWVDKALGLARFAAPILDAAPLARLPF